jgi:predicted transcriptional regulator
MTDPAISALTAFPDRLAECFAMFPDASQNWRPKSWDGIPSERLTAIEQICHVRDIEADGYHVRIARIPHENTPRISRANRLRWSASITSPIHDAPSLTFAWCVSRPK